jgi:predicted RecB family nuclease
LTAYKIAANQAPGAESAIAVDFAELKDHLERPVDLLFVDCEAVFYTYGRFECGKAAPRIKEAAQVRECVPILYSPPGKREPSDDLRICFGALAIAQLTRADVPRNGKIIWGEEFRIKTVTIADHLPRARQVIEAAASLCRIAEPSIVLNKHCPICDFQARCRALAIERDSLSLITGMTQKERAKCKEKGISSITQLSYGYRPRRRRRVKVGAPRVNPIIKHDHKLKALAIKKTQIHVVGSPSLSMDGTPVFMDVEGIPDRDFYYLVGLRYDLYGKQVERSFWANELEGERDMLRQCLLALQEIDNPRIVHYGAYEKRFLRRMMERWKTTAEEVDFINRIGDGSINLLASIYGKIYFPTYSNSLKEIGRWLGFEWSWPQASGQAATLLRRLWELSPDDTLRDRLIRYNMEDCRAIALIGGTIAQICDRDSGHKWTVVNTSELEVGFQRTFGKFPSALPDFEKINAAAYWDYQQSKVYVRGNKVSRRRAERTTKPLNAIVVEKEISIEEGPESCPKCGASKLWVLQTLRSRVVFDIKFTRKGIKRWSVRYRYKRYRCSKCRAEMVTLLRYLKYGYNLRAYVIYLLIELRLSHQKIAEHVETVFKIPILRSMANNIKFEMAKRYESTYREILRQISRGPLVHVDETRGGCLRWRSLCLDIRQPNIGRLCLFTFTRSVDIARGARRVRRCLGQRLLRIRFDVLPTAEMSDPSHA